MELKQDLKAVALDLDGTLLNSKKRLSSRSIASLRACLSRSIIVIIATGRPPRSVRQFLPPDILHRVELVCYNGALTFDTLGHSHSEWIPSSLSVRILNDVRKNVNQAYLSVESEDHLFTTMPPEIIHSQRFLFTPSTMSFQELVKIPANKILVSHFTTGLPVIEKYRKETSFVVTDGGSLVQMMRKGVSKASGVDRICRMKKISMSEVMAFGDDTNDLALFHTCGVPVAMDNAIERVKQSASLITRSNDEDGVAVILEQLLH
ncbi:Cof-type HAD-IIB family hydrolase [Sporolactobacillus vineae]|uniref:Cof-type HAD-IIB family hydrolase n=1 Tax=Sporolactobacillus vineae TaxID=444463 RepID=UPI00028A0057|nr:Cof-type HAD-IIB family hydrolase [Sporolactobacillus vineae]